MCGLFAARFWLLCAHMCLASLAWLGFWLGLACLGFDVSLPAFATKVPRTKTCAGLA